MLKNGIGEHFEKRFWWKFGEIGCWWNFEKRFWWTFWKKVLVKFGKKGFGERFGKRCWWNLEKKVLVKILKTKKRFWWTFWRQKRGFGEHFERRFWWTFWKKVLVNTEKRFWSSPSCRSPSPAGYWIRVPAPLGHLNVQIENLFNLDIWLSKKKIY